jgi:hypothetical protein
MRYRLKQKRVLLFASPWNLVWPFEEANRAMAKAPMAIWHLRFALETRR